MLCLFSNKKKKKKEEKETEINFQKHGSLLLEELIASSGGIYNPIRSFSSHQILQATTNFDRSSITVSLDRFVWYKGMIENRCVLIKKFEDFSQFNVDNFYRDVAISSMMSSHKNVLRLLGCCLEFSHPVLICEYPENGTTLNCIRGPWERDQKPIPWNVRLKIAKEIAEAVTYLHTKFPRTIIHRDLDLSNVFLDENWSVKLSSFSLCILIPEGESGVHDIVVGMYGYTDPDYMNTGFVTENVDIYSLGIIMLVLLTGKNKNTLEFPFLNLPVYIGKFLERGLFADLIDLTMLESPYDDIPKHQKLQMEAFIELVIRCVRSRPGEDMLHMIDVAKELKRIQKLT